VSIVPGRIATGEARHSGQPDRSIALVDFVRLFIHATHDLLAAAAADAPFSSSLLSSLCLTCRWWSFFYINRKLFLTLLSQPKLAKCRLFKKLYFTTF